MLVLITMMAVQMGPVHDRLDIGTHLLRLMALLAMYTITFSPHG